MGCLEVIRDFRKRLKNCTPQPNTHNPRRKEVTRLEGLFNAVGNLLREVGHVLVQIPAMTPVTPVEKVGKPRATKPKARPVHRTPEEIADRAAFFSRPDGDDREALAERARTTTKEVLLPDGDVEPVDDENTRAGQAAFAALVTAARSTTEAPQDHRAHFRAKLGLP